MIEGKRMSIYLREEQLEWLDAQSKAEGVSRTKFIEKRVFPQGLQILNERRGRPRKGEEK
jgi:hypothetical protein